MAPDNSNARENGGAEAAEAESPIARPSRRFGDEYVADEDGGGGGEEERDGGRDEEVVRAATATPEVCVTFCVHSVVPSVITCFISVIRPSLACFQPHFPLFPPHDQKPQIAPKPSLGRPTPQRAPQETAAPDQQPLHGEPDADVVADQTPRNPEDQAAAAPAAASTTDGQIAEHGESPEKLSLKARLKLFEKEIEQQGSAPAPKAGAHRAGRFVQYRWSTWSMDCVLRT